MNIQKFTQKSMEAIQDCEKLAYMNMWQSGNRAGTSFSGITAAGRWTDFKTD